MWKSREYDSTVTEKKMDDLPVWTLSFGVLKPFFRLYLTESRYMNRVGDGKEIVLFDPTCVHWYIVRTTFVMKAHHFTSVKFGISAFYSYFCTAAGRGNGLCWGATRQQHGCAHAKCNGLKKSRPTHGRLTVFRRAHPLRKPFRLRRNTLSWLFRVAKASILKILS